MELLVAPTARALVEPPAAAGQALLVAEPELVLTIVGQHC